MIVGKIIVSNEVFNIELIKGKFVSHGDYTSDDFLKMLSDPFDRLKVYVYESKNNCGVILDSPVYDCISARLFTTKLLTKYHDRSYFLQDNVCELTNMLYMLLGVPYKVEILYSMSNDCFTTNLFDLTSNQNFEGNGIDFESSISDLMMKIIDFYF